MIELGHGVRTVALESRGEACEALDVIVGVDAELAAEADSVLLDVGGAGHGETEAACGPPAQPPVFVVAQPSVRTALEVGERRQHETVLERVSVCEGEGLEKRRHPEAESLYSRPDRASCLIPVSSGDQLRRVRRTYAARANAAAPASVMAVALG